MKLAAKMTENIDNNIKTDIKPENKIEQVIPKPQEMVKLDKVPERQEGIKNLESAGLNRGDLTLEQHYQINMDRGASSADFFKIDTPNNKFKKYLQEVDGNFRPGKELDLEFLRDSHSVRGKIISRSDQPWYNARMFAVPGVTNIVPVYQGATVNRAVNHVDRVPYNYWEQPCDEGFSMCVGGFKAVLGGIDFVNFPGFATLNAARYGGSVSRNGRGYTINIGLKRLRTTDLSYVTESGNDYIDISLDKQKPKAINEPLRQAIYKDYSVDLKHIIEFAHNSSYQSPLCFSPIVEQLKLALYSDAVATGYDMIEGWNSGRYKQLVFNSQNRITLAENVNGDHQSGLDMLMTWCSFGQFTRLMNREVLPCDNDDVDFTPYQWIYIPVKWDWFRNYDKQGLISYILGLLPYPLVTAEYPVMEVEVEGNVGTHLLTSHETPVYVEHKSSRIRIDGYNYICLVIVDFPETATNLDPHNVDYPEDELSMPNMGHGVFRIPNLQFGISQLGDNYAGDIKQYMVHAMGAMLDGIFSDNLKLLNAYTVLTGTSVYNDIFGLVALLSTSSTTLYKDHYGYNQNTDPEDLLNGIPSIDSNVHEKHMVLAVPDFLQRLYYLIGFVRQSKGNFIYMWTYSDLSRVMMGHRLALANIKSEIICGKKNEIPNMVPVRYDNVLSGDIVNRRIAYSMCFEKYIKYAEWLRDSEYLGETGGLIRYISPMTQPGGVYRTGGLPVLETTQFLMHCNLLDWADYIENNLSRSPGALTELPINKILEVGEFIQTNQFIHINIKEHNSQNVQKVRALTNDIWGRVEFASHAHSDPFSLIRNNMIPGGNAGDHRHLQVCWACSTTAWNADLADGAADMPLYYCTIMKITINAVQEWYNGFFRAFDDLLPTYNWRDFQPQTIIMDINWVKRPLRFANLTSNLYLDAKTSVDYVNRNIWPNLNE